MADNSAFTKALHNFTMDASCGDAIRHLTDRGYTFDKIKESLTFPAKDEDIARVMWERLVENGAVLKVEDGLRQGDGSFVSIILMDQRMSGMEGTEALRLIREQENGLNSDTPVICLTADAVSGAREKYLPKDKIMV